FALGAAGVTTHSTLLQSFPGGGPQKLRVEVEVLGVRVSDETGFAPMPREGPSAVRAVSPDQAVWVYGPPAAVATVGIFAALAVVRLLVSTAAACRSDPLPAGAPAAPPGSFRPGR